MAASPAHRVMRDRGVSLSVYREVGRHTRPMRAAGVPADGFGGGTFRLGRPFFGLVLGEEDPDHAAQARVVRGALLGLLAARDDAAPEDLAVLDGRGDQRREREEL